MPKVTEKVFQSIGESLARLNYLNLYADADLSDKAFSLLALSRKKLIVTNVAYHNLTFLDLCGCKHIKDDSVIALT